MAINRAAFLGGGWGLPFFFFGFTKVISYYVHFSASFSSHSTVPRKNLKSIGLDLIQSF